MPTPEKKEEAAQATDTFSDGDCWDEDINEHIGAIDLAKGIPAQLTVAYQGFYYVYKIDSRAPIPVENLGTTPNSPVDSESRGAGAEKVTKEMIDLANELDNSGKGLVDP